MNDNEIDAIKKNPLFINLDLTSKEVINYYYELKEIINEYNNCISTNTICDKPFHFKMIRNQFNKLEIISYECPKYLNDLNYLKQKYLVYSNVKIEDNCFLTQISLESKLNDYHQNNLYQRKKINKAVNVLLKVSKNKSNDCLIYLISQSNLKTILFKSLLNTLILKKYKCAFINTKYLINELNNKNYEFDLIVEKIKDVDFLFIDGLGDEYNFSIEFFLIKLNNLINYRVNKNKPILINSLFTLDELRKNYLINFKYLSHKDQLNLELLNLTKTIKENISDKNLINLSIIKH